MTEGADIGRIEQRLYRQMLFNGFVGFAKSAVIGAVIGVIIGGMIAAAVGSGMLPELPFVGTLLQTSLQWGGAFAAATGGFGAVAGIQSTRDARRYGLMQEPPATTNGCANGSLLAPAHAPSPPDRKGQNHSQGVLARRGLTTTTVRDV